MGRLPFFGCIVLCFLGVLFVLRRVFILLFWYGCGEVLVVGVGVLLL